MLMPVDACYNLKSAPAAEHQHFNGGALQQSAVTDASRLGDFNRAIDLYAYQSPLVEP